MRVTYHINATTTKVNYAFSYCVGNTLIHGTNHFNINLKYL